MRDAHWLCAESERKIANQKKINKYKIIKEFTLIAFGWQEMITCYVTVVSCLFQFYFSFIFQIVLFYTLQIDDWHC